jgi:hypothetical protein
VLVLLQKMRRVLQKLMNWLKQAGINLAHRFQQATDWHTRAPAFAA